MKLYSPKFLSYYLCDKAMRGSSILRAVHDLVVQTLYVFGIMGRSLFVRQQFQTVKVSKKRKTFRQGISSEEVCVCLRLIIFDIMTSKVIIAGCKCVHAQY